MKDDTVSRAAVIETIKSHFRVDNDLLEVIVYEVAHLPAVQTCEDAVSRADVIELVKDSYYNLAESIEDTWTMVADVENLPAVQPQPVVRCKDCKHWLHEHQCIELSEFGTIETLPNEFCSRAERRTDGV